MKMFLLLALSVLASQSAFGAQVSGRLSRIGVDPAYPNLSPFYLREDAQNKYDSWQVYPANQMMNKALQALTSSLRQGTETSFYVCAEGKVLQADGDKGLYVFEAANIKKGRCL